MTKYLLSFSLLVLWACSSSPALKDKLPALAAQLDELGEEDSFSGVVLLSQKDQILLERNYGVADQDTQEPITGETKFNLASMNKMFTAVAIMQLRDAGKLDVQDRVGRHLPDYPDAVVRDSVTIEHLLTHTAGLGDYFNERFERANTDSIRSLADYLALFAGEPLAFAPGSDFGYSNAGFVVLGLIIEEITGRRYYDYIKDVIFSPLGMTDSGWGHADTLVPGLAKAYMVQDSAGVRQENPYLDVIGSSAGGGFSTVGDLLKFAKGLKAYQLVAQGTLEEMKTDRFDHGYGYGLSLRELNGHQVYGHNGGFPGVSGEVDIFEQDGIIAISLSNRGPRDGWATARTMIREAIVGQTEETAAFKNAERLVDTYAADGLAAARAQIASFGGELDERQLVHHAEQYNEKGDRAASLDILSLVVEAFPESWFPVSIMADLQMENGDTSLAVANWQKSLTINPGNQWAKDRLGELAGATESQ